MGARHWSGAPPAYLFPNTNPPPDASSVTPEMKLASSDSSQTMALAISRAWPTRPMAIVDSMADRVSRSASVFSVISVSIMPGRSGIELANILLAKRSGLRVIIMSGYTEETLSGLADQADLLQKPFTPRELRRRIREALDQVRDSSASSS